MKFFYEQPNTKQQSTFNWLSDQIYQITLTKFPPKFLKKSEEINGVKINLKDFIKVRNATSCDFHNTNFFLLFYRIPRF